MGRKAKERKRRERAAKSLALHTRDGAEQRPPPAQTSSPLDWPTAAPAELATRLNSVAIHLLRRLQREDYRLGLSAARLSALSVLVFGGPRTLGRLADAEGVSPPSMTRLVTAMEADGLVARERNASDGRSVVIRASEEGERVLLRGREQRVEALAGWLSALGREQLANLEQATGTLEETLRTERAHPPEASPLSPRVGSIVSA